VNPVDFCFFFGVEGLASEGKGRISIEQRGAPSLVAMDPVSGKPLEVQEFRAGASSPQVQADSSNRAFVVDDPASTTTLLPG
jgi:hypothetical protein